MNLIGLCFTAKGATLLRTIKNAYEKKEDKIECFTLNKFADGKVLFPLEQPLQELVRETFQTVDGFLFVGATGIAVRTVAPYLISKEVDPAVVVVDELGHYVISLLSGHLGGANELACDVADCIQAIPIITTATDLQHQFAVDNFAKKNGLSISEMVLAKEISARVLSGKKIGCYSDFPFKGAYPECFEEEEEGLTELGIYIGIREDKNPYKRTLRLVPPIVTIGIGCRKDTPFERLGERITEVLEQERISLRAVEQIVSIDLKSEEEGLLELSRKWKIPFQTFSKEDLLSVKGVFHDSAFVEEVVGVGNVCERAALFATGGTLVHHKDAKDGVTVALGIKEWSVYFE